MSLKSINPDGVVLIISTVALALALIVVVATYKRVSKTGSYGLGQCMGNAQWDSQSWATNLTAVGAILGTIIGGGQLSTLDKSTIDVFIQYTILNLVFLLLVSLAPLIYNIHGSLKRDAQEGLYYRGSVGGFLLACVLTLWGTIGELMTLLFVVGGLFGKSQTTFNSSLFIAQIFLLAALPLVLVYSWTAIPRILQEQVSGSTQNVREQAKSFMESMTVLPEVAKQQARSFAEAAMASAAKSEGGARWSLL